MHARPNTERAALRNGRRISLRLLRAGPEQNWPSHKWHSHRARRPVYRFKRLMALRKSTQSSRRRPCSTTAFRRQARGTFNAYCAFVSGIYRHPECRGAVSHPRPPSGQEQKVARRVYLRLPQIRSSGRNFQQPLSHCDLRS